MRQRRVAAMATEVLLRETRQRLDQRQLVPVDHAWVRVGPGVEQSQRTRDARAVLETLRDGRLGRRTESTDVLVLCRLVLRRRQNRAQPHQDGPRGVQQLRLIARERLLQELVELRRMRLQPSLVSAARDDIQRRERISDRPVVLLGHVGMNERALQQREAHLDVLPGGQRVHFLEELECVLRHLVRRDGLK